MLKTQASKRSALACADAKVSVAAADAMGYTVGGVYSPLLKGCLQLTPTHFGIRECLRSLSRGQGRKLLVRGDASLPQLELGLLVALFLLVATPEGTFGARGASMVCLHQ